jgi:hypothetical protein
MSSQRGGETKYALEMLWEKNEFCLSRCKSRPVAIDWHGIGERKSLLRNQNRATLLFYDFGTGADFFTLS